MKKICCIVIFMLFLMSSCGDYLGKTPTPTYDNDIVILTQEIPITTPQYDNQIVDDVVEFTASENCAYIWASRILPDLSAQLQDDFNNKGFNSLIISAEAYGENCIDPYTNQIKYFTAKQTDFRITFSVDDLSDETLGNHLYKILSVLSDYRDKNLPGAMLGYVSVRFGMGNEDRYFWFSLEDGLDAIENGFQGQTLIKILDL